MAKIIKLKMCLIKESWRYDIEIISLNSISGRDRDIVFILIHSYRNSYLNNRISHRIFALIFSRYTRQVPGDC